MPLWHVILSVTAALNSFRNQCHSVTWDMLHFSVSCLNVHQETPWKQSIKTGNTQGCKLPHCEAQCVWLHLYFSWSKLSVHLRETASPVPSFTSFHWSFCLYWIKSLQWDNKTTHWKSVRYQSRFILFAFNIMVLTRGLKSEEPDCTLIY